MTFSSIVPLSKGIIIIRPHMYLNFAAMRCTCILHGSEKHPDKKLKGIRAFGDCVVIPPSSTR